MRPFPWHSRCALGMPEKSVTHDNPLPKITAGSHVALLQKLSELAAK